MLNGAVTLGTMDGANVEIAQLVGEDNIYIFGQSSEEVISHYERGDYNASYYYNENPAIKEAVDFLLSDTMLQIGHREHLERLYYELINKDWFMTFPDFDDYCKQKEQAYHDYTDRLKWADKMLANISCAGYFSSDRTISEYNQEIWHLN